MIPIYEQSHGNGIGHSTNSFIYRFDEIWKQHLSEGRAKKFAFIFYDFTDSAIRKILKDQGVFAKLDRLSGQKLSIFYLHGGSRYAIERFNKQFLTALDVADKADLPCIVFFSFKDHEIGDLEVVQLDNANLIHGFNELYTAIAHYLANTENPSTSSRALKWIKSGSQFVSVEVFRAALRELLKGWF